MKALERAWKITPTGHIQKRFKFKNHTMAAQFIAKVAPIADELNHHPQILLRYRFATFDLKTNDVNSLTSKDDTLAVKIDEEFQAFDNGPATTKSKKLLVPLLLGEPIENVDKIHHLHHPISVIDSVPQYHLETLAQSINTIRKLDNMQKHQIWWHWCFLYTQLRISTHHQEHHHQEQDYKIGIRNSETVDLVSKDIDQVIDGLKFSELSELEQELQGTHSHHNQEYWDHLLYLVQSRSAYLQLTHLYERFKPLNDHFELQLDSDCTFDPLEQIKSDLPENELLFDSGTADPKYAARAIIGQAPQYQDKHAIVHNEPWLNTSVKGYRFTIHYRDMALSDTPRYNIQKLKDGTANIVFIAPNYPNLTFNIIDKPWDKSKWAEIKFLNTFERGTIKLEFGFKG